MKINKKEVIVVRPETLRYSSSQQLLPINCQRILFYAIRKFQNNTKSVSFSLSELQDYYHIDFGSWKEISEYMPKLRQFGMDVIDEKSGQIVGVNAFSVINYSRGTGIFNFKFTNEFLPQVSIQKRYLQYGPGQKSFKSKYTSYLYHWIKDNMYGKRDIVRNISLIEFKSIFLLPPTKYAGRNNNFKSRVWQPALDEINSYTGYYIEIEYKGKGENILYTIIRKENEEIVSNEVKTNEFTCHLGKERLDYGCEACYSINKCPFAVHFDTSLLPPQDVAIELYSQFTIHELMHYTFWSNPNYNVAKRVRNRVASEIELRYYNSVLEKNNITEMEIDKVSMDALFEKDKEQVSAHLLKTISEE